MVVNIGSNISPKNRPNYEFSKWKLYDGDSRGTPEIYCDCADLKSILKVIEEDKEYDLIRGFTTNPTLMHKAGVKNYLDFAQDTISNLLYNKPDATLSLEVFSDDFTKMYNQAIILDDLAKKFEFKNLYIKIPITNTNGESSEDLIAQLSFSGIKVNVTAVFSGMQIHNILPYLSPKTPSIISVFAGRIADTGIDPVRYFHDINLKNILKDTIAKFLWASPREVLHFDMAKEAGFDIITITPDLIKKLKENRDKSLDQYS